MREVIATGRNVEEATENGCKELGRSRDQVSVEILEMPLKKLFKTIPAKVRVTLDEPEAVVQQPSKAQPVQAAAPPKTEPIQKPLVQPKTEMPKSTTAVPVQAAPRAKREEIIKNDPEILIDLSVDPVAAGAVEYLTTVFQAMGSKTVRVAAYKQGEATLLRVEGEDISELVETRGETVQALSYLTDRSVNRGIDKKDPAYLRIRLDVAGYRGRREGELVTLANRTAKEVIDSNRSRTLAPMNPYERLIIHTTISEIEGVISESIGSDTERRVVVKSTAPDAKEGADWSKPNMSKGGRDNRREAGRDQNRNRRGAGSSAGNKRSGGSGQGGPRRDSRDKRDSGSDYAPRTNTPEREYADKPRDPNAAPVVPDHREAIRDGDNLPLYGKIEL